MSNFVTTDLLGSITSVLRPEPDFEFPDDAWGTVYIDGACCKGHFSTERFKEKSLDGDGFDYRLKCFLNVPKCGCNCRVICGSQVRFTGDDRTWEVTTQETTRHPKCNKWELQESDCDEC